MTNTEGNISILSKSLLEPSNNAGSYLNPITIQKELKKKKIKKVRSKDKRIPSARTDREYQYNDLANNIINGKISNSLKRKKKAMESKLSLNNKVDEVVDIRYFNYCINIFISYHANKSKRQYSLNSMIIKNQHIPKNNINSFEFNHEKNNLLQGIHTLTNLFLRI